MEEWKRMENVLFTTHFLEKDNLISTNQYYIVGSFRSLLHSYFEEGGMKISSFEFISKDPNRRFFRKKRNHFRYSFRVIRHIRRTWITKLNHDIWYIRNIFIKIENLFILIMKKILKIEKLSDSFENEISNYVEINSELLK